MFSPINAKLMLAKETAGALRYEEVDAGGKTVEMRDGHIGTIYLRKTNFPDGVFPAAIMVTVSPVIV